MFNVIRYFVVNNVNLGHYEIDYSFVNKQNLQIMVTLQRQT